MQGDLLRRLLLGGHKTSRPLTPPTRIFPGFSHVYHPNGLNGYCSLKAVPLKMVLAVGLLGGAHSSNDRGGGDGKPAGTSFNDLL